MSEQFTLYRLFDHDGTLLYVGATANIKARLSGHRSTYGAKLDQDRTQLTTYATEAELRRAERDAIATSPGRDNIAGVLQPHRPFQVAHSGPEPDCLHGAQPGSCRECRRIREQTIATAAGLHKMSIAKWRKTYGSSLLNATDAITSHLEAHPEDAELLDSEGFLPDRHDGPASPIASALHAFQEQYALIARRDVTLAVQELSKHFTLSDITAAWLEMLARESPPVVSGTATGQ